MRLGLIERGTRLKIGVQDVSGIESDAYDATFYDMHDLINETSFIVQCLKLNRNLNKLDKNAVLDISFSIGATVHTFTGRAAGKMYNDMVIIEQIDEIETVNRRKYQRDELHVELRLYELSEDKINESKYASPQTPPVLVDMSFDVSSGGMCIITDASLKPEYDPYYLAEFSLGEKDTFILPAKLVRRSKYARSKVGKNDYGFKFMFENMPNEMGRLTKAILSEKLSLSALW